MLKPESHPEQRLAVGLSVESRMVAALMAHETTFQNQLKAVKDVPENLSQICEQDCVNWEPVIAERDDLLAVLGFLKEGANQGKYEICASWRAGDGQLWSRMTRVSVWKPCPCKRRLTRPFIRLCALFQLIIGVCKNKCTRNFLKLWK